MEKNHLVKQNSLLSFQLNICAMIIVTTYWNLSNEEICPKSAFQLLLHFYNFSSEVFNLLMFLQENYDTNYLFWWDVVLVRCMCQVSSIMHDEKEHMGVWAKNDNMLRIKQQWKYHFIITMFI